MEEGKDYLIELTPDAEQFFLDVLEYFYKHHSLASADKKSEELLAKAISLESQPYRGRVEEKLAILGKGHRFLHYNYSQNRSIKIVYFIEEKEKTVYITDFFPTKMNESKFGRRNDPIED